MKAYTHGGRRTNSTKRVEDYLKALGFSAANVEKKNHYGGKVWSVDAFGIADVIACHPERLGVLFVSYTVGVSSNHLAHRRKIENLCGENPDCSRILKAGNRIIVLSWEHNDLPGIPRISSLTGVGVWESFSNPLDLMVPISRVIIQ